MRSLPLAVAKLTGAAGGAVNTVPTDSGSSATALTNFQVAQLLPAMPGSCGKAL